ncbi:hypothetical protein, partial [Stutzerimonas stutzeri]|uniref:hypothetical protein n=1 Tax=Stutzerimonas stutzeri TaxID=316 RepID=UPI00265CCB3C
CQSGVWRSSTLGSSWLSPAYTLDTASVGIDGLSQVFNLVERSKYKICTIARNYYRSYTYNYPSRNFLHECSIISSGSYWALRVRADIGVTQCQAICI